MKNNIIRIVFSSEEAAAVEYLLRIHSLAKPQDLIRFVVLTAYRSQRDNELRYRSRTGVPKKESQEDHIEAMRAMSPEALTAHLSDIEYFPADEPMADNKHVIMRHRIIDSPVDKKRYYLQEHYDTEQKKNTYSRTVFDFDELINDLRKEKKI